MELADPVTADATGTATTIGACTTDIFTVSHQSSPSPRSVV